MKRRRVKATGLEFRNLIIDELPALANQPGYRYGFFTKDRKRVNIETAATSVCIVKQM